MAINASLNKMYLLLLEEITEFRDLLKKKNPQNNLTIFHSPRPKPPGFFHGDIKPEGKQAWVTGDWWLPWMWMCCWCDFGDVSSRWQNISNTHGWWLGRGAWCCSNDVVLWWCCDSGDSGLNDGGMVVAMKQSALNMVWCEDGVMAIVVPAPMMMIAACLKMVEVVLIWTAVMIYQDVSCWWCDSSLPDWWWMKNGVRCYDLVQQWFGPSEVQIMVAVSLGDGMPWWWEMWWPLQAMEAGLPMIDLLMVLIWCASWCDSKMCCLMVMVKNEVTCDVVSTARWWQGMVLFKLR